MKNIRVTFRDNDFIVYQPKDKEVLELITDANGIAIHRQEWIEDKTRKWPNTIKTVIYPWDVIQSVERY